MLRWLMAALLCAWANLAAAAAPLSAYGKLPEFEDAAISPSGHAVAMIATNGEQRMIVVRDLKSGEITSRTIAGDVKLRGIQWAGDRHLVVVSSMTAGPVQLVRGKREWFVASVIDLQMKKVTPLLPESEKALNTIASYPTVRTVDGRPMIFVQGIQFTGYQGKLALFQTDVERVRPTVAAQTSVFTVDWVVGPDGAPLAYETYDGSSGRWSISLKVDNGGWREVVSAEAKLDGPYLIGQGRTAGSVLYAWPENNTWSWREVSASGASAEVAVMGPDQSAIRAPSNDQLIGYVRRDGDRKGYTFFDPVDARNWRLVQAAFPGDSVSLVSWSDDRRKFIVWVDSATQGPAYAFVDTNTRQATWLGAAYGDLQEADIGEQRPISFAAADGLKLTGYLTLPRGKAPKNLPLVVLPHGGPASRDTAGFDWWAQAMASRGYAVLQVNFRGSDGLGDALLEAGYGEWGRKMQTDLSDGVRHLAGAGIIDPKRVCIVGASYGGYAALAGAAFDGGVYRCAVSVAGVSDLKRQVAYSRAKGGAASERYWRRFMGAENPNDPILAERSPALHADRINIPVMLIHGQDDTVVHPDQSRVMADALRRDGRPVELVMQKGADHWLSRGETRLQMLQSLMAFVEKHNPPN